MAKDKSTQDAASGGAAAEFTSEKGDGDKEGAAASAELSSPKPAMVVFAQRAMWRGGRRPEDLMLPVSAVPAARRFAGFERLTLGDGNAHPLAAIPAKDGVTGVEYCCVFIEGGDVRFRLEADVTPPTAAVGIPIKN